MFTIAETRYRNAGTALRQRIWDPLEPSLANVKRVFLTPDHALNLIDFAALPVTKDEPLRLELEDFFESVATRRAPRVPGEQGLHALEVAHAIPAYPRRHGLTIINERDLPS